MTEANKVRVTLADLRETVVRKSTHVPGVLVDAVVSELDARLGIVGEHNRTTAVNEATVQSQAWIEWRIKEGLGDAGFDSILKNNVSD